MKAVIEKKTDYYPYSHDALPDGRMQKIVSTIYFLRIPIFYKVRLLILPQELIDAGWKQL